MALAPSSIKYTTAKDRVCGSCRKVRKCRYRAVKRKKPCGNYTHNDKIEAQVYGTQNN